MPTRVRPYVRRKDIDKPKLQEARVVVLTPPGETVIEKPTLREKLKKEFKLPPKKQKVQRPKTEAEEFADDAEDLAKTLDEMED